MRNNRNAFGIAEPRMVTIHSEPLHLPHYAILGLQPAETDWEWLGMLHAATNWGFRNAFPYRYIDSECHFDVFYAKRPGKFLPLILRNFAEEQTNSLVGFHTSSLHKIKNKNKTLPNQLSLFMDDDIPETLDLNDPQYAHDNPDDLRRWNEITALLSKDALPLESFSFLLPLQYTEYELYTSFLNHLDKVKGLHYRYISGNDLADDRLFYSILRFHTELKQKIYHSSGQYSSNE